MHIDPSWWTVAFLDISQIYGTPGLFQRVFQITCSKVLSHCITVVREAIRSGTIYDPLVPPFWTYSATILRFLSPQKYLLTKKNLYLISPVPMVWVATFILCFQMFSMDTHFPGTLEEQLCKNSKARRSSLLMYGPLFVIFAVVFLVFFILGFTSSFPTSIWFFLSGGVVGLCCTVPTFFAALRAATVPLSRWSGSKTFDELHRQFPSLRWNYQDGHDTQIHVLIQPEDWVHCSILQCISLCIEDAQQTCWICLIHTITCVYNHVWQF